MIQVINTVLHTYRTAGVLDCENLTIGNPLVEVYAK